MTRFAIVSTSLTIALSLAMSSCASVQHELSPTLETRAAASQSHHHYDEPASAPAPEHVNALHTDFAPGRNKAHNLVHTSIELAATRVIGWWRTPQAYDTLDYHQILDPNRALSGSVSLGSVRNGHLLNSAELPVESEHHSIIERHRRRNTRYGSDQIIELITYGARKVAAQFPGSVLRVGNIGRRGGGRIPWSNSHHTGRDADLAFYCVHIDDDLPVLAPDLLHFDDDGVSLERPDLRFDVARNWALARALLTHPEIRLQFLFISEGLKRLLLEHAESIGEDPELVAQARAVLHQPTDALPHNDHWHVRIACTKRDRLEGCLDAGPRWAWVDWHDEELLARSLELMRALEDEDRAVRLAALDYLERIRSPFAPEIALLRGVWDHDPVVKKRALEVAVAIPSWSATTIVAAKQFIADEHSTIDDRQHAYAILRRSGDALAVDFLLERLHHPAVTPAEKLFAARALSHIMDPALVPKLIDQLESQPPAVATELVRVLQRITNHTPPVEYLNGQRQAQSVSLWRNWWEANKERTRDEWLQESFAAHGITVDVLHDLRAVDHLIPLLRHAPEHVVYNANRRIQMLTHRWAPLEETDGETLHAHWTKWWGRNRARLLERMQPEQ